MASSSGHQLDEEATRDFFDDEESSNHTVVHEDEQTELGPRRFEEIQDFSEERSSKRRRVEKQKMDFSSYIENAASNCHQCSSSSTALNAFNEHLHCEEIPKITEEIIRLYSTPQHLEEALNLIHRVEGAFFDNNKLQAKVLAQRSTSNSVNVEGDVLIQFYDGRIVEANCSCKVSKTDILWCPHICAVLLMAARSPERIIHYSRYAKQVLEASREDLVAVVLALSKSNSLELHNISTLLVQKPAMKNLISPRILEDKELMNEISASLPVTAISSTHYVDVKLFQTKLEQTFAEFIKGVTISRSCEDDDEECECTCHQRGFTCEDCEERVYTKHDFGLVQELMQQYLDTVNRLIDHNDLYNGLNILESVGSSFVSLYTDLAESQLCGNMAQSNTSKTRYIKLLKDLCNTIQMLMLHPNNVVTQEQRVKWARLLESWKLESSELSSVIQPALDATNSGWIEPLLVKVLEGHEESIQAFQEANEVADIRLTTLIKRKELLKALFYARAVKRHALVSHIYVGMGNIAKSIVYAKTHMNTLSAATNLIHTIVCYIHSEIDQDKDKLMQHIIKQISDATRTSDEPPVMAQCLDDLRERLQDSISSLIPKMNNKEDHNIDRLIEEIHAIFAFGNLALRSFSTTEKFRVKKFGIYPWQTIEHDDEVNTISYLLHPMVQLCSIVNKAADMKDLISRFITDPERKLDLARLFDRIGHITLGIALAEEIVVHSINLKNLHSNTLRWICNLPAEKRTGFSAATSVANLIKDRLKYLRDEDIFIMRECARSCRTHNCLQEAFLFNTIVLVLALKDSFKKNSDFPIHVIQECFDTVTNYAEETNNEIPVTELIEVMIRIFKLPAFQNYTFTSSTFNDISDIAPVAYITRLESRNVDFMMSICNTLHSKKQLRSAYLLGSLTLEFHLLRPCPKITPITIANASIPENKITINCACPDCKTVKSFLKNATETQFRISASMRKSHILKQLSNTSAVQITEQGAGKNKVVVIVKDVTEHNKQIQKIQGEGKIREEYLVMTATLPKFILKVAQELDNEGKEQNGTPPEQQVHENVYSKKGHFHNAVHLLLEKDSNPEVAYEVINFMLKDVAMSADAISIGIKLFENSEQKDTEKFYLDPRTSLLQSLFQAAKSISNKTSAAKFAVLIFKNTPTTEAFETMRNFFVENLFQEWHSEFKTHILKWLAELCFNPSASMQDLQVYTKALITEGYIEEAVKAAESFRKDSLVKTIRLFKDLIIKFKQFRISEKEAAPYISKPLLELTQKVYSSTCDIYVTSSSSPTSSSSAPVTRPRNSIQTKACEDCDKLMDLLSSVYPALTIDMGNVKTELMKKYVTVEGNLSMYIAWLRTLYKFYQAAGQVQSGKWSEFLDNLYNFFESNTEFVNAIKSDPLLHPLPSTASITAGALPSSSSLLQPIRILQHQPPYMTKPIHVYPSNSSSSAFKSVVPPIVIPPIHTLSQQLSSPGTPTSSASSSHNNPSVHPVSSSYAIFPPTAVLSPSTPGGTPPPLLIPNISPSYQNPWNPPRLFSTANPSSSSNSSHPYPPSGTRQDPHQL